MPSTEPIRSSREFPVPWSGRPGLAPHVRLTFDRARAEHVLLGPESVAVLNRTGADILGLCDGRRTVAEIVAELRRRYNRVVDDEVQRFLARLVVKRYVEISHG
ncbi:MAG TPA: pyrroloquinoline quinone biosynthesis peptide chaperone PqqD [Amycolatopsis sp.]|uniref:pyrroloquinoline quinone biosynthesis peptide chaperone PqqD n=1 Tax=Amycolatopsis sp. TaxID=37632 RepID=UPI002B493973|nr:pyrroloquinoline quinone biosynthesis peptide chaperone PqqD [Amycolatopsis sp.]HKS49995.1 pyrroloquinoline quinone biosynthesis peptide chaperone PqqD [Amycolatopsis sp.]